MPVKSSHWIIFISSGSFYLKLERRNNSRPFPVLVILTFVNKNAISFLVVLERSFNLLFEYSRYRCESYTSFEQPTIILDTDN
jgi:hypothetical protein